MLDFSENGIPDRLFQNINHIVITACGTAIYAELEITVKTVCRFLEDTSNSFDIVELSKDYN